VSAVDDELNDIADAGVVPGKNSIRARTMISRATVSRKEKMD